MYELDHMMNGQATRQHHKDLIRQAHQEKLAHDIKAAHKEEKPALPRQSVLTTVVNMIARIG